jgi:molecular chaperone HscB
LTCCDCGAPLAAELDCFAALGLPRKLTIDPHTLEGAYHDLSRRIHPDRFANRPAAVRAASLGATAVLTRSYRTLRDPVARGLYWLELRGEKLGENNKNVPPELAEMVFGVHEQLDELRNSARNGAAADGDLARAVSARRADLQAIRDGLDRELGDNFGRWDALGAGDESARQRLAGELKNILSRIAYLRTLMRDVDRELDKGRAA